MARGVAVIGAGPGAAALHIPTLAEIAEQFRVVHVADGGSGRAAAVAGQLGARSSTGLDEALVDHEADVIALCSPPREHARQILAAVAAGKRAIFCEKPLATSHDDVDRVIDACRSSGTVLLVGTNHLFDAAWGRAAHYLRAGVRRVQRVSVTLAVPPNGRYHDLVAEGGPFTAPMGAMPDLTDPEAAAAMLRQLIMGLAVHDLHAVRDLAPDFEEMVYARLAAPVGYAVGFISSGVIVQLALTMHSDGPDALWRVTVSTDHDQLDVDFPPAFVHAGGATVRMRRANGEVTEYRRDGRDGYVAEWIALGRLLDGDDPMEYDEVRADAHYAIEIADAAAAALRKDGGA